MSLLARYPSFELHAGEATGTCRLVARSGVNGAEALGDIARAHAALDHPGIPRVVAHDPLGVTFASDAVLDLEACVARAEERGQRVPYPQAIAFVESLALALAHAHAVRSEEHPGGHFLGGISLRNLRIRPDGRLHLFGFGRNFVVRHHDGTPAIDPGAHLDERPASASSDVFTMLSLMRSLAPIIEMPSRLARLFRGERLGERDRLADLLEWGMKMILSRGPKVKGTTIEEAMSMYRLAWRVIGVSPDPDGMRATFVDILATPAGDGISLDGDRVVLASGRVVDLATRGAARRMVLALAQASRQGRALTTDELFTAGWPGQRLDEATRSRRVRVELSRLRSLGLREAIQHGDRGFSLRLRS